MQFSKSMFFAAVALVAPLAMSAASVTSNPTLSLGDMSFSGFSCSLSSSGGSASLPNTCGQISVGTITTPGMGIQFSSGFVATNGAFEDATLGYNVTSASGITAIGLDFNGTFLGQSVAQVTETIWSGSTEVAQAVVNCGAGGCTTANETATIALNGSYTDLSVTKDILLASFASGDQNISTASWVDQTFTEGPGTTVASTPEPASLALIGAGLLGVGLIRRKMVKA